MKLFLIAVTVAAVAMAMPAQNDDSSSSSSSISGYLPTIPSLPSEASGYIPSDFQNIIKVCREDATKCQEAVNNYRPSLPGNYTG